MFRSKLQQSADECRDALRECDVALGEWERLLAKRHPETLTVADLNQMRSDLLRNVAAIRRLVRSMTELV